MNEGISGKIVVITGASSGLGEAAARLLASQGAAVVLGARRAERLASLVNEVTAGGGKALAVTTDVADRAQVKALVDAGVKAHGRIDVMLNNAGLMPQSLLERLKVDEWDRMIDVNIKGVLYGIAAALPHMTAQKAGHIINVSSVAGHRVGPGSTVYAATKFAARSRPNCPTASPTATRPPASSNSTRRSRSPRPRSRAPSPSRSASPRMSTSTRSCSARRARIIERGAPCFA